MTPRVVASIEARVGSSRLPGKVLVDVCGKPALTRLLDRVAQCRMIDAVVVATSREAADDAVEQCARAQGVACYRGSEEDVLERVVEAHRMMRSEIVVELTGDCTLLDPGIVDLGVKTFLENECDVVSNTSKLSFPMGIDVQVFRLAALERVAETINDPAIREHVSLYFYEHPEQYRIIHLFAPPRWHAPDVRLQLDYPEDLQLIRETYRRLEPQYGGTFGVEEVLALLRSDAALAAVNRACVEKDAR
jgi:spore coat polysaccharide biosynthesis protein SpsF